MSSAPEDNPPARPADPPLRQTDQLLRIASIVSPLALATALLLYFGWVRIQAQAEAFSTDASVFEMSPQEFVIRTVDVLFFPIILVLLACLLWIRIDAFLTARGSTVARVLRWAWLLIPLGLAIRSLAPRSGDIVFPLWVMLAIGATAYAGRLQRQSEDRQENPRRTLIVGALITVVLFWQTERLARLVGETHSQDLKDNVSELPEVALYTERKLNLAAPGVTETAAADPDSAYPFRYDGLYFLQRSGKKYFLITDGWNDDQGRLIVLPDNDSLRLEFGG